MLQKQRNIEFERGFKMSSGEGDGDFAKHAAHVLRELNEKRDNEKVDLQLLNERFSSYINRVKKLETKNFQLLTEIDELHSKWGSESVKISESREPELIKFRRQIDEITKQKVIFELKAKRAESDTEEFRNIMDMALDLSSADKIKIQNLERLLESTKQDGEYFKSQLENIKEQISKHSVEHQRHTDHLKQLKDDLDKQSLDRINIESEIQTLEEQAVFLRAVHEQEVIEMGQMQSIAGFDPTHFYRTELDRAVRDIKNDFEQLNGAQKRELEEWYKFKVEETEYNIEKEKEFCKANISIVNNEEISSLRATVNESTRETYCLQQKHAELIQHLKMLEEKLEKTKSSNQIKAEERERDIVLLNEQIRELMHTYDELLSRKTSLEFEISTYRRLLECEETRVANVAESKQTANSSILHSTAISKSLRQNSASPVSTNDSQEIHDEIEIENKIDVGLTKRIQLHRNFKGPIGIKEVSSDGKFIILENIGKHGDSNISNWKIIRKIDNEPEIVYTFPLNTTIACGGTVKVWSKGCGKTNPPFEFENNVDWRIGVQMFTKLVDSKNKELSKITETHKFSH